MDDDHPLDPKEVLGHGHRAECIDGPPTGNDDGEERGGRGDLVAPPVGLDLARPNITELTGDRLRDPDRAGVVAVHHDCPQGYGHGEGFAGRRLVEPWLLIECKSVEVVHRQAPHQGRTGALPWPKPKRTCRGCPNDTVPREAILGAPVRCSARGARPWPCRPPAPSRRWC